MLTGDLALSWRRGNKVGPRYIDESDKYYIEVARDLIDIFREHKERRRAEIEEELDEYVGAGTDYRIMRGLIKLLTDRCLFETATISDPSEIRRALFLKARAHHPVAVITREQIVSEVAAELNCSAEAIAEGLYGDLTANQRLIDFEELSATELIDRYNLAQAQALLYRCIAMELKIEPQDTVGYRRLFDAIKKYRLIHAIRGSAVAGYEITLSGPVSIFHRSQKYGVQMAVFLPALIACKRWSLRAEIDMKSRGSAFFELQSNQTRLRSDYLGEYAIENSFIEKLSAKWRDDGWTLERTNEVIDLGIGAFIPDFVLQRDGAEPVYLEILGFWTPRYLSERLKEFEAARFRNFLLAVSDELKGSRDELTNPPPNVLVFKSSLDPRDVRAALEQM